MTNIWQWILPEIDVLLTYLKNYVKKVPHLNNLGNISLLITFLKLISPLRTRTWKGWPYDQNLKSFHPRKQNLRWHLLQLLQKRLINKKLKIVNGGWTSTICTSKVDNIKWARKNWFLLVKICHSTNKFFGHNRQMKKKKINPKKRKNIPKEKTNKLWWQKN